MFNVKLIRFKNESQDHIHIAAPFDCGVEPGGEVDVPEEWARPHRFGNGGRRKSAIECLAPQLKPVDKVFAAEWAKAPSEDAPVRAPAKGRTADDLVRDGVPRGVAELRAKGGK